MKRRTLLQGATGIALGAIAGPALGGAFGSSVGAQGTGGTAKNVIFMMGDGMGAAHRNAGQLVSVGAYGRLVMDTLPVAGAMGTNSVDPEGSITDSAAAATAMACGVKTVNGAVGVDASGQSVTNIVELAKQAGKLIGVVTTSQVTDASGAAFGAHVASRSDQSEIARQYIEEAQIDVILGGGEDFWYPEGTAGMFPDNPPEDEEEASKSDKGNLVDRAKELGYAYVSSADELAAASGPKLLGLFANEEMFQQRPEGEGDIYEPVVSLEAMTQKAIEILSQSPNGFFLFVEEEVIDEMAADNNSTQTIKGVLELDKAVAVAKAFAEQDGNTLLIVTADHECGGMTVESIGDPEDPDESGGEGDLTISAEDGPFPIAGSGYQFVVDWTTTDHTGVRVPVTAMGPGSELLAGTYENTQVFVAMASALGVELPAGIPGTPTPGIAPGMVATPAA